MNIHPLTWDELAKMYKESTGRSAFCFDMDHVFEWAEKQKDKFIVSDDGRLYLREDDLGVSI